MAVIVKMQDYQFRTECEIAGGWHMQGNKKDEIIAGGLYYFDVTKSEDLKFTTNSLERERFQKQARIILLKWILIIMIVSFLGIRQIFYIELRLQHKQQGRN